MSSVGGISVFARGIDILMMNSSLVKASEI